MLAENVIEAISIKTKTTTKIQSQTFDRSASNLIWSLWDHSKSCEIDSEARNKV